MFFGGAGVSTASNIPDFRSSAGIYNKEYLYSPETILSKSFFYNHTKEFYDFYINNMVYLNALPNSAHIKLAEMENNSSLKAVITQNIDELHQKAGSRNVLELHGSIYRNHCINCNKPYSIEFINNNLPIPKCDCGGIIKPNVVLYGETLDDNIINASIKHIENADTLIVGGTSLSVYPAASLTSYFKGKNLVLINKSKTALDNTATLLINEDISEVFRQLKNPSKY